MKFALMCCHGLINKALQVIIEDFFVKDSIHEKCIVHFNLFYIPIECDNQTENDIQSGWVNHKAKGLKEIDFTCVFKAMNENVYRLFYMMSIVMLRTIYVSM